MDKISPAARSRIMASIRGKNTRPELVVRRLLHRLGYRYRLHRKSLPGCPDLVFTSRRKVVFVHGCFWHSHPRCRRATTPSSNRRFWKDKLSANRRRDRQAIRQLKKQKWQALIIWECETRDAKKLRSHLTQFLEQTE